MSDVLYEKGKIRITRLSFINGRDQSFSIASIKHIRDEHRNKPLLPLILGVVLGIIAGVFDNLFPDSQTILGVASGLFTLYYFTDKDRYTIFVTLHKTEILAFKTNKERVFVEVLTNLRRAVDEHKKPIA